MSDIVTSILQPVGQVLSLANPITGAAQLNPVSQRVTLGELESTAAKEEAELKARQLENNAKRLRAEADDAIKRGEDRVIDLKTDGKVIIGAQRAALAAQGVDISDIDSSAQQIQDDTAQQIDLQALTIRNNAWRESFGLKTKASDLELGADITRSGGEFESEVIKLETAAGATEQALSLATLGIGNFSGSNGQRRSGGGGGGSRSTGGGFFSAN